MQSFYMVDGTDMVYEVWDVITGEYMQAIYA